jgi:hypothetical protein
MDKLDIHSRQDRTRFHHAIPEHVQFKTHELFLSGIFHSYFQMVVELRKLKLQIRGDD